MNSKMNKKRFEQLEKMLVSGKTPVIIFLLLIVNIFILRQWPSSENRRINSILVCFLAFSVINWFFRKYANTKQ